MIVGSRKLVILWTSEEGEAWAQHPKFSQRDPPKTLTM